ncbi:hypothetical protein [Mastigocladopsis repens]|uniref:hypothetical protein n=1 Tax=Mastigocladopsis repens TaxID=221287 RepID=UPI00030C0E92|nr:hypothetical protein [Mastigocladopsis repens]
MEHWQFLIQKQGERSWRPLESPNVEIIEGRYRVVARSKLTNIDVEVRVTHSSTLELPPKRRIQKRSRRTNSEGLIAVIPFTYLKPGVWELRCSGDLMSDFLGKPWQHSVQLQVLPKVTTEQVGRGDTGRWGQENQEELPVFTDELPKQAAIIEQPISPVWLKGETVEQILHNLIEVALPPCELPVEDDKTLEDAAADFPEPLLVLKLKEEIYIARWGQTLTINGSVEQKEATNLDLGQTPNYERVYGGEIRIELRSPQGSKIIRRIRQSLPEKLIPFSIRSSIEIPVDCESKLILGEISLYGILTIGGKAILLANQSFSITADVTELLAISAAANKSEPDTLKDAPVPSAALATSATKKPSIPLDLKLFNLVKTPKKARSLLLHPSPKKSLPPRINPQSLRKSAAISPQLPRFAQRQNKMISPAAVVSESPSKLESSYRGTTVTVTAVSHVTSIGTTFPYLRRLKALPDETEFIKRNTPEMFDFHAPVDSQQHSTEILNEDAAQSVAEDAQSQDTSFVELVIPRTSELITTGSSNISPLIRKWMHTQGYSLPEPINLQNQDYDTYTVPSQEQIPEEINTQMHRHGDIENIQKEIEVQQTAEEPQAVEEEITPLSPPLPPHRRTSSAWLAQEIVVDETFDEAEVEPFKNQSSKQQEESVSDVSVCLPVVAEITEPLSVPQLHLLPGELISGKSIRVSVQLAQVYPQVAVKLWVEDCQTRWLLEGPRLLTNLLPNSCGGMEEITHINIPFGCLEIRLEAIAVDMVTQQESHKVTIHRSVVPPDLPTLQLDELLGI